MITVLGLIYLTQAVKPVSYGNDLQAIDVKIADLEIQKTDLEAENARLTALETVRNSTVARQMTQPASTEYVQE
jgi:hypothetical protein